EKLVAEFPRVVRPRAELARTFVFLGDLLASKGRSQDGGEAYGQAVARFEKLLAEFPSVPEYRSWLRRAYIGRGGISNHLGECGKAVAAFSRAIELKPAYGEAWSAWSGRGVAFAELGQWDKAAADFEKATQLTADDALTWYHLALVRLQLGDRDGYRKACSGMLKRFGQSADVNAARCTSWTCALAQEAVGDWG